MCFIRLSVEARKTVLLWISQALLRWGLPVQNPSQSRPLCGKRSFVPQYSRPGTTPFLGKKRKIHLVLVAVTSVIDLFLNELMREKGTLIFQKHLVVFPLCIWYKKKILLLFWDLRQLNRTCLVLTISAGKNVY